MPLPLIIIMETDHQYTNAATKRIREVIEEHKGTFRFSSGTSGLMCVACKLELDSFEKCHVDAHLCSESHDVAFKRFCQRLKYDKSINRKGKDHQNIIVPVDLATVGTAFIDQVIVFMPNQAGLQCNYCEEAVQDSVISLCEHLATAAHRRCRGKLLYQNDDIELIEMVEKYPKDFCFESHNKLKCRRCDADMTATYVSLIRHIKTKRHRNKKGCEFFVDPSGQVVTERGEGNIPLATNFQDK